MFQIRVFMGLLFLSVSTPLIAGEIPKPNFEKVCSIQKNQAIQQSSAAGLAVLSCREIADHPSTWPQLARVLRDPRFFVGAIGSALVISRWEDILHGGLQFFKASDIEDSLGKLLGTRVPGQKKAFDDAVQKGDPDEISRKARTLKEAAARKKAREIAEGYIRIVLGQSFASENSEEPMSSPSGNPVSPEEMKEAVREASGSILGMKVPAEKEVFDKAVKSGQESEIKHAGRALRRAAAGKGEAEVADDYITHSHH